MRSSARRRVSSSTQGSRLEGWAGVWVERTVSGAGHSVEPVFCRGSLELVKGPEMRYDQKD